jgi:sulfopyruvate decarboxylase subunit beta
MQTPEKRLIGILEQEGIDYILGLPCDRMKGLFSVLAGLKGFIPLTREEEGVGISAGIALGGARPAIFLQSSGIGNMINALLSLTGFYRLSLPLFISHRGIYREAIAAQLPMGKALKGILKAAGIGYSTIGKQEDLEKIHRGLPRIFRKEITHAFLLSPRVWEGCKEPSPHFPSKRPVPPGPLNPVRKRPYYRRFRILEIIKDQLKGKIVISNLGVPSKELYHLCHQDSNFYMLGSMGMATPIGLGVSLTTDREVIVIDGDGSLLMNPGTLATIAHLSPTNLTILAIDNGSYGSTGDQPTHAGSVTDLSLVARGFGIGNVVKVSAKDEIRAALSSRKKGPRFIHTIALPGNEPVPNIPISHEEIKKSFQRTLLSV